MVGGWLAAHASALCVFCGTLGPWRGGTWYMMVDSHTHVRLPASTHALPATPPSRTHTRTCTQALTDASPRSKHGGELKQRAGEVQARHLELSHRALHTFRLLDALEGRLAASIGCAGVGGGGAVGGVGVQGAVGEVGVGWGVEVIGRWSDISQRWHECVCVCVCI